MLRKVLPVVLVAAGVGGGIGAGIATRPEPEPVPISDEYDGTAQHAVETPESGTTEREYVKLNNQFVVPLVREGKVDALIVMALSIEVDVGHRESVFSREPKIRDSFLQVMFDHANVGGFRGAFTEAENLAVLRSALKEVAVRDLGKHVSDVLILEIARQDY